MEKIVLSVNEMDQLQDKLADSYYFIVKYLQGVSISQMEDDILKSSEAISRSQVNGEFDDNDFNRFVRPDLEAMEYFCKKHKDFCSNMFFLKKNKKYFYKSYYLDLFREVEIEIKKSELNTFFVRYELI